MSTLEATGGRAACVRCGRAAPGAAAAPAGWGGRFHNGRLIALACPACLTEAELAEIAAREGASLWEVASGRRAPAGELRDLVPEAWFAALPAGAEVLGVVAGDVRAGALRVAWVHSDEEGRTACVTNVPLARWAELEEVYVPYRAQQLAARLDR